MGFTPGIAENIKVKASESPFHCLIRLWEDTGHASVSEFLYRLRSIKREDCIELLLEDISQVVSEKELQIIMEESKGPFKTVCIPEERVDVWNELEEEDKYRSQSEYPLVYLSYHIECRVEAKDLAKKLEEKGLVVMVDFWFTSERREMGEVQWRENAMKTARKILVLSSPGYKKACERTTSASSHAKDDFGCRIDYNYIITDIVSKNFVNKKALVITMDRETALCVPHQLLNYPATLWESMSEVPDELLLSIWDRQKYKKPTVQRTPVIPPTIVEKFPKKKKK
jgi:predicted CopG family antitoxin